MIARRLGGPFALWAVSAMLAASGAVAQDGPAAPPCGGVEIGRGAVRHVVDGRTVLLVDGREVRLAGIEVPPSASPAAAATPESAAAKTALEALAGGEPVLLRGTEVATDRYGRLVAYAYTLRDDTELFLQGELVTAGLARVGTAVGSHNCAIDLFERETAARAAKLGLWANSYYDVLHADQPADVLAQRGHFALVEGAVLSVHESGATIYVNFGRRWSDEFSVTIAKRNERSFAAVGLDPKSLEGRRIRVRGWIEARGAHGSPWIEALHPEQIELDDRN